MNNLIQWFQSTYRYWVLLLYLIIIVLLCISIFQKHQTANQPTIEPQITLNLDEPLKRIEQLERQIEIQKNEIKQQTSSNDALSLNIKQLEKRLQAHTELLKRTCEYIVVITVDKKIVPRQCLPEYNWRREEGIN